MTVQNKINAQQLKSDEKVLDYNIIKPVLGLGLGYGV